MTPDALERFERCPRLARWHKDHLQLRVRPLACLYAGIEAGVEGRSAKDAVMAQAANPGLDLSGVETYSVAVHLAHLAEIISAYLTADQKPWIRAGSAYELGGDLRRIVLIDRWSEDRKLSEIRSWRTIAPVCQMDAPMLINAITIGPSVDNRRSSPWSRGWTHPRNNGLRFRKKDGESLGEGWNLQWRERSGMTTERWLARLQQDKMFDELVHSVKVAVPRRREEFLKDIERIEREIAELPENPPMRRSSCFGISPCTFLSVCHAPAPMVPSECGWVRIADIAKSPVSAQFCATVG